METVEMLKAREERKGRGGWVGERVKEWIEERGR
jgi:hypothetical protein